MYRETDTLAPASLHDDWERFQVKFRASLRDNRNVLRDFSTAKLVEHSTTASRLCLSVVGAEAATRLDSDYKPFLQQLWRKVTGRDVEVEIMARGIVGSDAMAVAAEKRIVMKTGRTTGHVGMYMLQEEPIIPKPPPTGVLSATVSLGIENFVDWELRRHKCFTPALCIGYVYGRYNVSQAFLKSTVRNKDGKVGMTEIRRIAVYLTKALTPLNNSEIGRQFNGMSGRFVAIAIEAIDERRVRDEVFDAMIQGHLKYLRGRQEAVQRASAPIMFVRA